MRGAFAHPEMLLAKFKQTSVAQLCKEHPALDLAQALDQLQSDPPFLRDDSASIPDKVVSVQFREISFRHEVSCTTGIPRPLTGSVLNEF